MLNCVYKVRLNNDLDVLSGSVYNYTTSSKDNIVPIDDPRFGPATTTVKCMYCNSLSSCPGHYGTIELQYPIVQIIAYKAFVPLIESLCSVCSRVMLSDQQILHVLKLPKTKRLQTITNFVRKTYEDETMNITCPRCNNIVRRMLVDYEPSVKTNVDKGNGFDNELFTRKERGLKIGMVSTRTENETIVINPITIKTILNNFGLNPSHVMIDGSKLTISELSLTGLNESFHPRNFMTNLVVVMTNKLRMSVATATMSEHMPVYYNNYYNNIIKHNVELGKMTSLPLAFVHGSELHKGFYELYAALYSNYRLIVDSGSSGVKSKLLKAAKIIRKQKYDVVPLLQIFKSKKTTPFNSGIISMRHDNSSRTVGGGTFDTVPSRILLPYEVMFKCTMNYPVYKENLSFVKMLISRMSVGAIANAPMTKPYALFKPKQNIYRRIRSDNALTVAEMVEPGDKLLLNLKEHDIVLTSRFPSVQEESWGAFEAQAYDLDRIIRLAMQVCKKMQFDFDGDEIQSYSMKDHHLDVSLLLNMHASHQFVGYNRGTLMVIYDADIPVGFNFLTRIKDVSVRDWHYDRACSVEKRLNEIMEKLFKDHPLTFSGKGVNIVNNKIVSIGEANLMSSDLNVFIYREYGQMKAVEFMHSVTQLSYDLARHFGVSYSNDFSISSDEVKTCVESLINKTYIDMMKYQRFTDMKSEIMQYNLANDMAKSLEKYIIDYLKDSYMGKIGETKRAGELRSGMGALGWSLDAMTNRKNPNCLYSNIRSIVTHPSFPINPEAVGFIRHGYIGALTATEHFFDCMNSWRGIYDRGMSTAITGYSSKREGGIYGIAYTSSNGHVVTDRYILSLVYGASGLNGRYCFHLPLPDIKLSQDDFVKKYKGYDRLIELYNDIHCDTSRYRKHTHIITQDMVEDKFVAGYPYNNIIDRLPDGETKRSDVDSFIDELNELFFSKNNKGYEYVRIALKHHEYYFRVMFTLKQLDKKTRDDLIYRFMTSLVDGGDPVGIQATLTMTQTLTQQMLDSIHKVGGKSADMDNVKEGSGLQRYCELTDGNQQHYIILHIALKDDSREKCIEFIRDYDTIYFVEIWSTMDIILSYEIPKEVREWHDKIDFSTVHTNPHHLEIVIDPYLLASHDLHVADIIKTLTAKYDIIQFITVVVFNNDKQESIDDHNESGALNSLGTNDVMVMYIFFNVQTPYNKIEAFAKSLSQWKNGVIVHGRGIRNSCIVEDVNNPGHYYIKANEINNFLMGDMKNKYRTNAYLDILLDDRIDPSRCRINDLSTMRKIYGVFEANAQHIESVYYTAMILSSGMTNIRPCHMKTMSDVVYHRNDELYAHRSYMKRAEDIDIYRRISFESAGEMISNSLVQDSTYEMTDHVSATMYGKLSAQGVGYAPVTISLVN